MVALVFGASRAVAQPANANLARTSDIVFVGTVQRVGATASAAIDAAPGSMVVRVDDVTAKPPAISLKRGDAVTVFAKDPHAWHAGDRATFYTAWKVSADTVAVEEQGHEPAPAAPHVMAGEERGVAAPAPTQRAADDRKLQQRIADADTVVVGKVVSVKPAPPAAAAEPGLERAERRGPISEHNPDWQQAVIQVESPIKGARPNQNVTVVFPGSRDVAFKDVPKLARGQQGTFIIGRSPAAATNAGGEEAGATALTVQQVLPRTEAARVRSLAHE
jgi:hypothetical protein